MFLCDTWTSFFFFFFLCLWTCLLTTPTLSSLDPINYQLLLIIARCCYTFDPLYPLPLTFLVQAIDNSFLDYSIPFPTGLFGMSFVIPNWSIWHEFCHSSVHPIDSSWFNLPKQNSDLLFLSRILMKKLPCSNTLNNFIFFNVLECSPRTFSWKLTLSRWSFTLTYSCLTLPCPA